MYERPFKEYEILPATLKKVRKNYTDTADEGSDYLCSIDYIETEIGNFVLDVLYTQKAMEYTEPKTAEMLTKDQIIKAVVESNNGGRGFARAVEKQCRMMDNNKTTFRWFHQKDNKAVRIFSHSAEVQNLTYFPKGWEKLWPDFYKAVTSYMKLGKNEHDDAPDTLTGMVEQRDKGNSKDLSGIFH
jgi:predicted phage terminase large subunit-like protein